MPTTNPKSPPGRRVHSDAIRKRLEEAVDVVSGGVRQAFEARTGIPHATFANWCGPSRRISKPRNRRPPPIERLDIGHLWRLAENAGVDLDYLITGAFNITRGSSRSAPSLGTDLLAHVRLKIGERLPSTLPRPGELLDNAIGYAKRVREEREKHWVGMTGLEKYKKTYSDSEIASLLKQALAAGIEPLGDSPGDDGDVD